MGTWDRQKDWKEMDGEIVKSRNKSNRVIPELKNLKVAPTKSQNLFYKIKLFFKNLFRL